jgi:hypothetical protein
MSSGFIGPDGTTPAAIGVAAVQYYFDINGPSSVAVPLLIRGGGSLSASGDGDASVSYSFFQGDSGGAVYTNECNTGSLSPFCGSFTYSDQRSLLSGDGTTAGMIGSIQIRANFGASNGSASAMIDPMIVIDPTFADANLYTITFSDGVTNGGGQRSVPEPATWAMMIAGFGLVGFALRRHRKVATRVSFAC